MIVARAPCRCRHWLILYQLCYVGLSLHAFAASRIEIKRWTARSNNTSKPMHASVPGYIVLDLLKNGDPYRDFAETDLSFVSLQDWIYEAHALLEVEHDESELDPARKNWAAQLYFEKLDTVATVEAEGQALRSNRGQSVVDNAFLPHAFPLFQSSGSLPSSISVRVVIRSSLREAIQRATSVFNDKQYPHTINYNVWSEPTHRNVLRKPASDFGWVSVALHHSGTLIDVVAIQDWGPSFPGAGIPGRVYLEYGPPGWAYLHHGIQVEQVFDSEGGVTMSVTVRVRRLPGIPTVSQRLVVKFGELYTIDDAIHANEHNKTFKFRLERPRLWYPRGSRHFVDPPALYKLRVQLSQEVLEKQVGIRKVSLSASGEFAVYVNDERIDWRGTNVVPFDAFSTRRGDSLPRVVLETALRLHTNAFRVWGGGYLPADDFYQACDEYGFLVWQDLPWACAVFPASANFLQGAYEETTHIVHSLQSHASIVVWGGNNEVEAALDWFDETRLKRSLYERDYVKLFIDTIGEAVRFSSNPSVIYIDSSPSNGWYPNNTKIWGDVTNPDLGDIHFYNYSMNCEAEIEYPKALFVSEHGVQSLPFSLPKYASKRKFNTVLKVRQRHENGFEQMDAQTVRMFPRTQGSLSGLPYRNRALLSQIVQGRCLTSAVTAWRSFRNNHGIMLWQLNDVWPGVSWSLLEYDLSWKASAYAVRGAFAPLRFLLRRRGADIVVYMQGFSEFFGNELFGHFLLSEFDWQMPGQLVNSMMFKVRVMDNDIELGRMTTDKGIRLQGLGFLDSGINHEVYVIDDWIEPRSGFVDFAFHEQKTSSLLNWQVAGCRVLLRNKSQFAVPYVWLSSTVSTVHFSANSFLIMAGESKEIIATCPGAKDADTYSCRHLQQVLTVESLLETHASANFEVGSKA